MARLLAKMVLTYLGGSHLFQVTLNPQRRSHGHKTKTVADTSYTTNFYLQDPSTSCHILPPHQQDQGQNHPGPSPSARATQTQPTLQITTGSIIGVYVEEQQSVVAWGPDRPWQSFHNILDPSHWQAANLHGWQFRSADGSLHSPQQGISLLLSLAAFSWWLRPSQVGCSPGLSFHWSKHCVF